MRLEHWKEQKRRMRMVECDRSKKAPSLSHHTAAAFLEMFLMEKWVYFPLHRNLGWLLMVLNASVWQMIYLVFKMIGTFSFHYDPKLTSKRAAPLLGSCTRKCPKDGIQLSFIFQIPSRPKCQTSE